MHVFRRRSTYHRLQSISFAQAVHSNLSPNRELQQIRFPRFDTSVARTLAATSPSIKSVGLCGNALSSRAAALGEEGFLPDRPAICYKTLKPRVSDSLQWTVRFRCRWCHLADEPPWCCPKSFGISGHILS